MSDPRRSREQALKKRRLRIVIEVDVPARDWNRRKLNQAVVRLVGSTATDLHPGGETVLLATEEVELNNA